MEKYLVTFIFGTRPEAIKLAPVILAFKSDKNGLNDIQKTSIQNISLQEKSLKKWQGQREE